MIAIYRFKPDIIIGSSFGGFIAMFLLQTQVWNGNTILLFKKRMWLPKAYKKNIVMMTERDDTTVLLRELAKLQESSSDNIEFLVMENNHGLYKSMIEEGQLRILIGNNSQSTMTADRINDYFDCIKSWVICMLRFVVSFIPSAKVLISAGDEHIKSIL